MKNAAVFAVAAAAFCGAAQAQVIIAYTPTLQYNAVVMHHAPVIVQSNPYPIAPYVAGAVFNGGILAAQTLSAYRSGTVPITMPLTYQRYDYNVQYAYRNHYIQHSPGVAPYYPAPRR